MKRVSVDSHQSCRVDEEARVRMKHQSLLQDYLELQKDFVSKKRKLQIAKQKRETILAEVRFLRRRQTYLLKIKSAKLEPEQDILQQKKSDIQRKMHIKERKYSAREAALKNLPPVLDSEVILDGGEEEEGGRKEQEVWEPQRVEKKPKNCLINDKRVGKKKISWQDQVALKV
ncbi:hypothetical protein L1049_013864 [Liquidambar formosana]|uniref:Uncharacterized protein n=1 Tax=Liquidambar formosana TaxID=63359 RepID=A0AAP0WUQ0_LIQFO